MEETTPTFIQEYFGEYGIMGSIIVILVVHHRIFVLKTEISKNDFNKRSPEETPAEEPEPEPLLIHCPACGTEVSRYAPACLKCGHPICPTESTHNETIINVQPRRKKTEAVVLWSLLGLIVLIVASIFFNFIGYFIALIILALCRVFSAGEAIFLLSRPRGFLVVPRPAATRQVALLNPDRRYCGAITAHVVGDSINSLITYFKPVYRA